MTSNIPTLSDLYRLAEQLELDKDASIKALRARDYRIGKACPATDDSARLLYWLREVRDPGAADDRHKAPALSESTAAYAARLLAVVVGFAAMMSLLLSSGHGLVNVFLFVLIFVFFQFAMSFLSAWAMYKTLTGHVPVVLPVNPAKLLLSRIYPDPRYFREMQAVLRIAFLRYGQEMGALFTIGAMAGFLVVLGLSEFTFVWGSTFQLSDALVAAFTDTLSWPWSSLLPLATIDAQLIADSRFHPALTGLSRADIAGTRGWWPFLFMSMLCYALLPRLLLWLASRFYFRKSIKASFVNYPCADLVVSRMRSPLVETQGAAGADVTPAAAPGGAQGGPGPAVRPDGGLLLLHWADALGDRELYAFEEFAAVPAGNVIALGGGSLAQDAQALQQAVQRPVDRLLLLVKSWEPPLADLADVLANCSPGTPCTVYPLALPGRVVAEEKLADWQRFARSLPFDTVDVRTLEDV